MLRKEVRRLLTIIMLFCFAVSGLHVYAAENRVGEIVDGSTLTDEMEVEYREYSRARGTYLASGTGRVTNLGGRQVYVSGGTNCHRVSDEVKVTLHLQRLEGGSWVNTGQVVTGISYNTYEVSAGNTFSVTGGYYYRVYGTHTAKKGSTSESCSSYSDGLWVS